MRKKQIFLISIFIFFFLASIFFYQTKQAKKVIAGSSENVWGFAFGGNPETEGGVLKANSGWISFNRKNCDANDDGRSDGNPVGCPPAGTLIPNYGVNIDPTSLKLSGRAWSGGGQEGGNSVQVFGWLSFNRSETLSPPSDDPCPDGSCLAKVGNVDPAICDIDNNGHLDLQCGGNNSSAPLNNYRQVFGWARFLSACDANNDGIFGDCQNGPCSNCGGWDGWLKLSHRSSNPSKNYGLVIDTTTNPREFRGWAFGGEVVGWISFNTSNYSGGSDYKVLSSISFNQPPVAQIRCCPEGCSNPPGVCRGYQGIFCLRNDSTDPDGNLQNSMWQIVETGYTSDCQAISGTAICNLTPSLPTNPSTPVTYTARLRAIDAQGLENQTELTFQLLQDIQVNFTCSLSATNTWQECNGLWVALGQTLYLHDDSTPSTGATITSRSWSFENGDPATSNQQNPSVKFLSIGAKHITLTVTDSAGRSKSLTKIINVRQLPIWFPVPPR